ncbi:TPA: hypothetical protein ACH3X1_009441 [Trebouxia sp. C0004]
MSYLQAITGVKLKVTRSEEALAILSSTSLFVACCEALLGRKLEGIKRCPASAHERADNIQTVIWELSHTVLRTDLSHISSKGVVSGDPVDVHNLLEIVSALLATDDQLITTEIQEQLRGDDSCADHQISHASHNVQPNASRMRADSHAEAEQFCSPDQKPSRSSQDALHQQYTLTAASAPSPASIRPKQWSASTSSHYKAAEHGANHSSQCSQCINSTADAAANCGDAADARASADGDGDASGSSDAAYQHQEQQQQGKQAHANVDSDAAEHVRQHQQQGRKPAGKAAVGKRKLRVKKQGGRAPLVMSKCYAAAVAPAQQDGPWQADSQGRLQEDRSRRGGHSDEGTHVGSGRLPLIDPSMTAKLAHLYALNRDDPKSSHQRQRYEAAGHQAEQQRVAVQKQAWLKQSLARRRIEAARQHQQLLLHSRAQAFQAKVDAIRSAQHAAEAAAAEESQRLRRAAAQEAMLKETFLEAVEAEKERLLLARDQALQHRPSSSSSAPQADKSSQKAASGWMGVLKQHCADLEVGLAQEHQNRVRQEREKALLQQAFRQDAKRLEREQIEARLVRVAALDDAALFRSMHSAKHHQTLKSQLRQSIQLASC